MSNFVYDKENNLVEIGSNIEIEGRISGKGNVIQIADASAPSQLKINISGDNNRIILGRGFIRI